MNGQFFGSERDAMSDSKLSKLDDAREGRTPDFVYSWPYAKSTRIDTLKFRNIDDLKHAF